LPFASIAIGKNVIGVPVVVLEVLNNSDMPVTAVVFEIECSNGFGEPVTWPGQGNIHRGIYQSTIERKAKVKIEATLNLRQTTSQVTAWVTRIKFQDGSEWSQTRQEAEANGRTMSIKSR
jgi:hypothetical protein